MILKSHVARGEVVVVRAVIIAPLSVVSVYSENYINARVHISAILRIVCIILLLNRSVLCILVFVLL